MSNRVEEAWDKAAACQARAQATTDGKLKAMFLKLRESWLRIAKNAQFQDDVKDARQRSGRLSVFP